MPGILLLPDGAGRAPAALLLHGYTSHKEQMAGAVGGALLQVGVASLSLDLPLHGDRSGSIQELSMRSPLELVRQWTIANDEAALAIDWLAAQPEIDGRRIGMVGYSLGAYLSVLVAAREPRVRAMVLAAGGDLPKHTPFERLLRAIADPVRAIRRVHGRPLLMLHGKWDRTVLPEQAQRLFDAAGEPKELRWHDAGHWLPQPAVQAAAAWLAERLEEAKPARREAVEAGD